MRQVIAAARTRLGDVRPALIGIAGPVAVGKSTVAAALADALDAHVISTDAFLLTNDVLGQRDLAMRKGFPESYDAGLIDTTLRRMREGETVEIPVYSHDIYDIVAGRMDVIEPVDIAVIEGVVALQPPVRRHLDLAVYVDAPVDIVRGWFVDRFVRWTAEAAEGTFYHGFKRMPDDEVRLVAEMTWDAINAVNLKEHIAPSMADADVIVRKGDGHEVVEVISIDG